MTPIQQTYMQAKRGDGDAIVVLTTAILPTLGTGMHARRHIQRIVRNYMMPKDKRVTDRSLMTGTGWTLEKLRDYKAKVKAYLCEIRQSLPSVQNSQAEKKTCTKCGEEKEISSFPRSKLTKSGLGSWCKACTHLYSATLPVAA